MNLTCHIAQPLQAKHEFVVDRAANHDLAGSDVLFLFSSDRKPHPPHSMDHSIDPIERSHLTLILMNLLIILVCSYKHLPILVFL